MSCTLIGILDDGWAGLADAARERLRTASVVIGAARTLELVRDHLPEGVDCRNMDVALDALPGWIESARGDGRAVALVATGDPLCHGVASWLAARIGAEAFEILPNLSTLQLACARFKKPWHDIAIASCHGHDSGEWTAGAGPAHGLYGVLRAVAQHALVFVFAGPRNTPARLARALLEAGYGDEVKLFVACRLQLADEEIHAELSLPEVAQREFAAPNVVIVQRELRAEGELAAFGLDDGEYLQRSPDKGLITKQEARAVSLARLAITPSATVWDIGAGSGAVGIEAARLAPRGHVFAIEKNSDDAANARANAKRFRATNYTLEVGRAPAGLDAWPDPDAVFVGGSDGEVATLIDLVLARLKPGGRLVMNFVTLENLAVATSALAAAGVAWDVGQLQASRSRPILELHRMVAQNPVWIVCANKEIR